MTDAACNESVSDINYISRATQVNIAVGHALDVRKFIGLQVDHCKCTTSTITAPTRRSASSAMGCESVERLEPRAGM